MNREIKPLNHTPNTCNVKIVREKKKGVVDALSSKVTPIT
jgi:hypothetical protein